MSRHILVAMEMAAASEAALDFALDEYPDATITVLHVLESGDPLDLFAKPEPTEYIIPDCDYDLTDELLPDAGRFERGQCKIAEKVFDHACQIADGYGKEIELAVESGKTANEISEYAATHTVDQIVIGDRNYRGVSRVLFGNIATSIGRRTSIPVTIIS
ncbi:universal stress protein [Halalkalicoccus sp. GCM10025322]|uniref:universal stress protein n=1 Tax=Halalkalicoccus TaxID=332246 RepID=UPI002F96BD17